MKGLKAEIKLLYTKIELNKANQENKELKDQINTMIKNAKERESNVKDLISIKDMYKNEYRKEHNELIKLRNEYKLLVEDYTKQTKKLNNLQKKTNK